MFEIKPYLIYKFIFVVVITWLILQINYWIITSVAVALGLNEIYNKLAGWYYYGRSPRVN